MFTGIVTEMGRVVAVTPTDEGRRLRIECWSVLSGLGIGDSVAVNGVCLTVVAADPTGFEVEAVPETLQRTNLGTLQAGDRVDLERPVGATGLFDGHIVQGHVDGTATVVGRADEGDSIRMAFAVPQPFMKYIVEKGSVCVDGVSLTVAGVDAGGFSVALIPHTLDATVLGDRKPGDAVNLEVDILAKYLERLVEARP